MDRYSISDLAQLSGIKAHTLRVWEQRYSIIRPKRTDTNLRAYNDDDLKLVLNIALLKEHGYKISFIARLSADEMHGEINRLLARHVNYPDQIQALTLAMLDLDEVRFEQIVTANSRQLGFEATMTHVVFPFLNRISMFWLTGVVGMAQEHFVSCLIRRKLMAAIDGLPHLLRPGAKTYLLFLPEGEWHEIGLLFANYLIRVRQNKAIYLGQSLPVSELTAAYSRHHPDFIFTTITSASTSQDVQADITQLAQQFPESCLLVTGYQVVGQNLTLPDSVIVLNTIDDLSRIAES